MNTELSLQLLQAYATGLAAQSMQQQLDLIEVISKYL